LWLRATHYLNILFMSFMIRSGIEILSAHPKLYWNDDCTPGSEWLSFTRKKLPEDRLWTSMDEEVGWSPWLALPGRTNLGLGRHWHFFTLLGWILTGVVYVVLLFVADEWRRLIPTSWSVVPAAWHNFVAYATFHVVKEPGYNALQQLSYAAVTFLLAPFAILTGAAMSPAIAGRFPWYTRLFGGRQAARSLHFLSLMAFVLFTLIHTAMVIIHGLPDEWPKIVLGPAYIDRPTGIAVGVLGLVVIGVLQVVATRMSLRRPRLVRHLLGAVVDRVRYAFLHGLTSRQRYAPAEKSPYFRVNGRPPRDATWNALACDGFKDWALEVGGLVDRPLRVSLDDLKEMERQTQITKHVCIQGWSAVGEWTGVPLWRIIEACHPQPGARYVVFHSYDDKWEQPGHGYYYETIDLEIARHPQTLLAYAMNGQPLPPEHGAPLRLRVETQLGFKMVKYLRAIEFVADYDKIAEGQGGWREDVQHYSQGAGI
jgi:DMSO/TMAO reductase YedYZ molybdopterin-dependent catalytic subunit/thiosulfate reductase cytochrome b subunit